MLQIALINNINKHSDITHSDITLLQNESIHQNDNLNVNLDDSLNDTSRNTSNNIKNIQQNDKNITSSVSESETVIGGENISYKLLLIRQQPSRARSCGNGSKDFRHIDPVPIIKYQKK